MFAALHSRTVKNPASICRRAGFTLVELAIVVMIISLVLGGVVVGHSLIRNSQLQSIAGEYQKYVQAIGQFHQKYRALPGDIHNASTIWAGAYDGDGNGYIAEDHDEHLNAWIHLARSELIEKNFNNSESTSLRIPGINVPTSQLDGAGWGLIYVSYDDAITAGEPIVYLGADAPPNHTLWLGGRSYTGKPGIVEPKLTAEEAEQIDIKLDDGIPGTGKILAQYTAGADDDCDVSGTSYNVAVSGAICSLVFKTGY